MSQECTCNENESSSWVSCKVHSGTNAGRETYVHVKDALDSWSRTLLHIEEYAGVHKHLCEAYWILKEKYDA